MTAATVPGVVLAQDDGPQSVPAAYYGSVTIDGDPAPVGTVITAIIDGEAHGSIEVTNAGTYGGPNALDEKLVVQGAESGDIVTFVADGVEAAETVTWESGAVTEVNLTFENVPEETQTGDTDSSDSAEQTDDVTESEPQATESAAQASNSGQESGEPPIATETEPEQVEVGESVPEVTTATISGAMTEVVLDTGQSLSRVGFESDVEIEATVSVSELSEPETPEPEGKTFVSGAEITFESGNPDQVKTVRFGVSQSALDTAGITPGQLLVHHLEEETDVWEPLETSVVTEANGEVILEAPSAGFSKYGVFADNADGTAMEAQTTSIEPESTTDGIDTTTGSVAESTPTETSMTAEEPTTTDQEKAELAGLAPTMVIGAVLGVIVIVAAVSVLRRRL